MKTERIIISVLVITVLILLGGVFVIRRAAGIYKNSNRTSIEYTEEAHTESTAAIYNPYIGYYDIYGYRIKEDAYIGTEVTWHIDATDPNGRLVLLEIDLEDYADGAISEHGLMEIEAIISMWTGAGKELMIRFLYDFAGKATDTEPKSIDIIKLHMSQCAEILNKYKNSVYLTQGIFLGDIGEMHHSNYMDTPEMRELGEYYSTVLDPGIFLSVRTPEHYRIISGRDEPIGEDEAYSSELAARIGLFNDGMLASANDLGTYGEGELHTNEEHEGKGSREEEIAFQNKLCLYVPSGGEVVSDNEYNDLKNAVKDLRDMHVSFIGRYHDEAVKDKWRSEVYDASSYGDSIYDGMSGYDYIERHLGYRYVVRSAGGSSKLCLRVHRDSEGISTTCNEGMPEGDLRVEILIENVGFSPAYKVFETELCISDGNTVLFTLPIDIRTIRPGEVSRITADIPLDKPAAGDYELRLHMYDPVTGEDILFANEEDQYGGLLLGSLKYKELDDETLDKLFYDYLMENGISGITELLREEYGRR